MRPQVDQLVGIHCHTLQVRFEDGAVGVADLSTEFPPGKITAILGPSGCGKSTLLRAIAGMAPTHSGDVEFSPRRSAQRQDDLSFVFQDAALVPWRTARENVQLPLELTRDIDPKQWPPRVAEQLHAVELTPADGDKTPAQLSGGMRMRVSVARALVTDPAVLLLDEPFAALDELLRTRLGELLHSLWQRRQRTVLFVTHNIAEAILLSHRILIMAEGSLCAELENPLPFPRTAASRSDSKFAAFYNEVAARLTEVAV